MQGRLFQLWQCVRDQTEQIEKIPPPPPYTFYFYFCIFYFVIFFCYFFAMFCVDIFNFFCTLYVYKFWDSRYRKKRKRNLLIGQPQGSLSEGIDTTVFICFDLKLLFLVACLLED